MTTQCFLKLDALTTPYQFSTGTNNAPIGTGPWGGTVGWFNRWLGTTRGSAADHVDVASVASNTTGIEFPGSVGGTVPGAWISAPLDQDVTISGTITFNLWMGENTTSVNAGAMCVIERIDSTGAIASTIASSAKGTELPKTSSIAAQNWTVTATSTNMLKGDRLRVRVLIKNVGTMGTDATGCQFSLNGTTAAALGDSYVQFTETFGFLTSDPTTTTLYPTTTRPGTPDFGSSASLLSDFTGTDESPLSEGGNWAQLSTTSSDRGKRVGNQFGVIAANTRSHSYWTPSNIGPDCEAYITVVTTPAGAGQRVLLYARVQGEGGANTHDGYVVTLDPSTGDVVLVSVLNASFTTLATASATGFANGNKLGIRCVGPKIEAWRHDGSSWALLTSANDTTYASAGKVAFAMLDTGTSGRLDDVYAGNVTSTFDTAAVDREAWTSRGGGVLTDVTNTAAGWTAPIQVTDTAGGTVVDWWTKPLQAFTLAAPVLVNVRGLESNAAANAVFRCEIAAAASDGSGATVWAGTTYPSELSTLEVAYQFYLAGDDLAVTDGQRLRVRFTIDDTAGVAMGASQTVTLYYAGTSGAASGDTYLILGQTLTEFVAPIPTLVMAQPYRG